MLTQILSINNEPKQEQENLKLGLLSENEVINSYIIKNRMNTNSGEAEVYICEKDNQKYVLKYYYNLTPKYEILEKLKGIGNPDIVSLYEYGEYNDHFYEILEYAAGGALNTRNADGKYKYIPVTEDKAVGIVKEIINGLNECHKLGIVHRDIKPGNIFYKNATGDDILIGDFGISSYVDVEDGMSKHLTQTSARTEGYFAPEAYSGVIGSEIDYYALGVTLWELLTGKEPFVGSDGKALFPGQIVNDTIQGKVVDNLLNRSPNLSLRMKTLIRGLMTICHDKRWNYDSVTRFLNGEDVTVFQEVNQLPPITIKDKQCTSYKEIAEQLLEDKEYGIQFVFKGGLVRYLVKINKSFADKLADKLDEYSANDNMEEGLLYAAYKICPNLGFKLSDKISVCSIRDIEDILKNRPYLILPYLKDKSKGLFQYLNVIGMSEISEKVWQIVEKSNYDDFIVPKILLAFTGNTISPFKDGVNDKIVLSTMKDFARLPENLKKRVMLFVDAANISVCAWLENASGKDINQWRKLSVSLNSEDEKLPKFDLFCRLLIKNYQIPELPGTETEINNIIDLLNENGVSKGLLSDFFFKKLFDLKNYAECSKLLEAALDCSYEDLCYGIDFYVAKYAECCLKLNDSSKSLKFFEMAQKLNPKVANYYILGAMAALNVENTTSAFNMAEKAVSRAPDNKWALYVKGAAFYAKEKYTEAVSTITLAIEMEKQELFLNLRADAYDKLAEKGAPEFKKKAADDRAKAKNAKKQIDLTVEIPKINSFKQNNDLEKARFEQFSKLKAEAKGV